MVSRAVLFIVVTSVAVLARNHDRTTRTGATSSKS
jgi:hypothetical protein